jgi:hypothetical protein
MNKWTKMGNAEIRMKMSSMELEYESIKNKINNLISELDKLDIEYNNAKKELNKRSK